MNNIFLIISDSYYFIKESLDKIYGDFSNVVKLDFNNLEVDDLLYEFSSVSLFDDKKYVIVENADKLFSKGTSDELLLKYLDNPSDITTVIFVSKTYDKKNPIYLKIKDSYKVLEDVKRTKYTLINDIKTYVKNHKSCISDDALNYIIDSCLNDYDLILSEIDKLLILGKDNISDELAYNLVTLTPDGNNNRFIDALMDMNYKDALISVENMKILNIDISTLVALLAWNVRVVYLIKRYRKDKTKLDEILSVYKVKDFNYNKYVRRGNIRTEVELLDLIISLSEIDTSLKEYKLDKDNVGPYLINLFCI